MASNMLINNTSARNITLNTYVDKKLVRVKLLPGLNTINSDRWAAVKSYKYCKSLMEQGYIETSDTAIKQAKRVSEKKEAKTKLASEEKEAKADPFAAL